MGSLWRYHLENWRALGTDVEEILGGGGVLRNGWRWGKGVRGGNSNNEERWLVF